MKIIKSRRTNSHLGLFASLFAVALFATVAFTLNSTKPASAATVPESCFSFTPGTGTITAYDPTGTDPLCLKDVDIPATIGGVDVTSIGTAAFFEKSLTSVTFSDSMVNIGVASFQGNQITSVIFGSKVQVINHAAFEDNNLTSIDLPQSVTTIGCNTFAGNQIKDLSIGDNVTDICGGSIAQGSPLETLSIGTAGFAGVPHIELDSGFASDIATLKNLYLGKSVLSIGSGVFQGTAIENLYLPANIDSVSGGAFYQSNLKEVTVEGGVALTLGVFNLTVPRTGQYIRLLTSDPSNPYGYVDQADTYIVNPAAVTVKYVDSHGNALSPELYQTGATLTDYTTAANPTADFSLYYRSGQSLSYSASAISGYQTPTGQSISLLPGANTVTFVYYTPAEIAAMNTPEAPNTGLKRAVSPVVYVVVGVIGTAVITGTIFARKRYANL